MTDVTNNVNTNVKGFESIVEFGISEGRSAAEIYSCVSSFGYTGSVEDIQQYMARKEAATVATSVKIKEPVTIKGIVGLKNHIAYNKQGITIQSIYLRSEETHDKETRETFVNQYIDMRPVILNENYLYRNCDKESQEVIEQFLDDNFIEIEDKIIFNTIVDKRKLSAKVAQKGDRYPGSRSLLVVSAAEDLTRVNSILSGIYVNWALGIFATKSIYGYKSLMSNQNQRPQYYKKDVFFDKNGNLHDSCDRYIFFNSTTSMKRKKQYIAARCNSKEDLEKVTRTLDNMTHGAFGMNKGVVCDRAKNIQISDRMGLALTSNKDLGAISCYAIFDGKWEHETEDEQHKSVQFFDGSAIISASYAAKIYGAELQENISEKSAMTLWPQFRTMGTAKAFGAVLPDSVIEQIIKRMENNGVKVVRFPEVTQDTVAKIAKGEFKNCLIIVGKGLPEVLMDRNNLKTYSDFTREAHFNILDIAKPTPTRTNIQTVQSLSLTENFEDTLFELGKETVDSRLNSIISQTNLPIDIKAAQSGYIPNVIPSIANDYVRREPAIWQQIVTNAMKGLEKDISRMNFSLEGTFARGTGDFGCFFGIRVIDDGQIFIKGIKAGVECQVTRTPKAGISEHYMAKTIDMDYVRKVVGKSGLTREERIAVIKAFDSIPEGVVAVPASDEFKNTTGGSDLDFDAFSIVWDERWVRLAKQVQQNAIGIKYTEAKQRDDKHTFGLESMKTGWKDFVCSNNENIGSICNRNSLIMALMTTPKHIAIPVMREIFPSIGKNKYERMFDGNDVAIGNIEISSVLRQAQTCNLSDDESRLNFLLDLNAIFCSLEGRVIDAAKTGEVVPSFLRGVLAQFQASINTRVYLLGAKDGVVINNKLTESDYYPNPGEDMVRTVPCRVVEVLDKVAEYAAQELTKVYNPLEFKEEHNILFEEGLAGKSVKTLIDIKTMYIDAMGIFANTTVGVYDAGDEDIVKNTSVTRTEAMAYIGNLIRAVTNNLSAQERWAFAKYVSMRGKGGMLRDDGGNAFYTTLEQETILAVSDLFGVNKTVGTEVKLTAAYKEGQVVQFKDGRANCAIAVKGKFDGEFEIKKIGDKHYAITDIESVVKVPEIDNRLVIKFHSEATKNRNSTIKALLAAEKLVVTADSNGKDNIYSVSQDGEYTQVARIYIQDNGLLSKFYNGLKIKVDHVLVGNVNKSDNSNNKTTAVLLFARHDGYIEMTAEEKAKIQSAYNAKVKRLGDAVRGIPVTEAPVESAPEINPLVAKAKAAAAACDYTQIFANIIGDATL